MLLADTSVWIEHLRCGHADLVLHLEAGNVLMHPFIAGELACGTLKNRTLLLAGFHALPKATEASNVEVSSFLEKRKLWGLGLGWVDLHLLVSARLTGCRLLTLDKRLARAATDLGLA